MKRNITHLLITAILLTSGCALASTLTVESDKQEFKDAESKIYLEGDVKIQAGDVNVLSPRAVVEIDKKNNKVNNVEFKDNAYSYQMKDGKKHEIKAQILKMSLLNKAFSAEGNTLSSITEKGKPLVIVTADKQEYNKHTSVMKATGNVNILYKNVETLSKEAIVNLNENNDVKRIQLIGNAKLSQDNSRINADKLDYDNTKQEAIAVGNVYTDIITEDKQNIKVWSNYQSFDKKNNVVTASGSTKIQYEDYVATGPKVIVVPDKTTKKLNEAIFVGRAKIETKGRTIEADKISITMNPKDFKAEGNVKSILPNIGTMK